MFPSASSHESNAEFPTRKPSGWTFDIIKPFLWSSVVGSRIVCRLTITGAFFLGGFALIGSVVKFSNLFRRDLTIALSLNSQMDDRFDLFSTSHIFRSLVLF